MEPNFDELSHIGMEFTLPRVNNRQATKEEIKKLREDINDEVKKTEVLVLDDIGAESNNDWIRDNILQVILQYRMQENLPTFFTSNLTMLELVYLHSVLS